MSRRARPRLRVLLGEATAMGPGKADLLEAIQRTGSISAAAREMGMSYRRAWELVDTMNRCFKDALVDTSTGGSGGGGAHVTETGLQAVQRYREMELKAAKSIRREMQAFSRLLSPLPTERD